MARNKVKIVITGDSTGLQKATGSAEKAMGGFSSRIGGMGAKIAGAVGVAFATDKIIGFGGELLALGTTAEVTFKKADTIFGNSSKAVQDWADKNNEAFGVSDEKLLGMASSFGDLLKPMGFTEKQAATMSEEVIGLSGALSAWSGGKVDAAGASDILASAMLGERESLKSLGISISQADVDARLLKKGQEELTGSAREQAEALATQELIFEKSTDAQKAWADGSLDTVKTQNELKATWDDAKTALATGLMPVFKQGMNFLRNTAVPAVKQVIAVFNGDGLAGVFSLVAGKIREAWPTIKATLSEWAKKFGDWVAEATPPMLTKLGELIAAFANWATETGLPLLTQKLVEWGNAFVAWIGPMIPPMLVKLGEVVLAIAGWIVTDAVPALSRAAGELTIALAGWVVDLAPKVLEGLGGFLSVIGAWFTDVAAPRIAEVGSRMWGGLLDGLRNVIGGIKSWWNSIDLNISIPDIPGVPGRGQSFDLIPDIAAANGFDGMITKPTTFLVGEAGPEHVKVTPAGRSSSGGSGRPIVVNLVMDGRVVSKQMIPHLRAVERGLQGVS